MDCIKNSFWRLFLSALTQLIAGSSELAIGCESPSSLDVIAAYGRFFIACPSSSIPNQEIKPMRELRDDSLVDMKFIMEDSGFSDRYFYKHIQKGNFPPPIKYGRASKWLYRDYQTWKCSFLPDIKKAS